MEALLVDVTNKLPWYRVADFLRDKETLSRRIDREGVPFATTRLPAIFDGVIMALESGVASFPGFETLNRGGITYPKLFSGMVKCVLDHSRPEHDRVAAMEAIYQLSYAFKKLQGPYQPEVLRKQLAEFIEVDTSLKDFDYLSEPLRDITSRASDIITEVLQGLDPFDHAQAEIFLPKPGPGASNTPRPKSTRYEARVDYLSMSEAFNWREWFSPPSSPPRHGGQHRSKWISNDLKAFFARPRYNTAFESPCDVKDAATARFKFVPKTNKKPRGICIEECETMWLQQGLRHALVKRIESHPITKGYVNFTSQQINRELALQSSADLSSATLDMSSASDRIRRALVAFLLRKVGALREAILSCSTETVELPTDFPHEFGDSITLNKIAPMGSAICFPIMALTHFALIKAIIEHSVVPQRFKRNVYVYGDDIIVPADCVPAIYDWLPLYGMKFNVEKSFVHSQFRESCGLHAYEGHEITPVRFKIARSHLHLSDVPGLLRLEEAFYNKGYRKTAERIRIQVQRCAIRHGIYYFYPVSPTSQLFGFYRKDASLDEFVQSVPGKWHEETDLKKPWYQCQLYTVPVLADEKVESPPLVGERGYLRWLTEGSQTAPIVEDCLPDKKQVGWRTLPESSLGYSRSEEGSRPEVTNPLDATG
jgi:hypothetical protein